MELTCLHEVLHDGVVFLQVEWGVGCVMVLSLH
jgi:hypothetical protein